MNKFVTLGLCLHCFISFFLMLMGVFYILPKSILIGVLGLAVALILGSGIFVYTLPMFARSGARRDYIMCQTFSAAAVANYISFLLIAGFAKKLNEEADWFTTAFVLGGLFGLIAWVQWEVKLHNRSREERNHQAAVLESKRLQELDAPKDAEDKLKESLLQAEVTFGSYHLHPAQAAIDLGNFYLKQADRNKAARMFAKALIIRRLLLGEEDVRVIRTLMDWISTDDNLELTQAVTEMHRALLILEQQLGAYAPPVALLYERLGELQQSQNQSVEAENALRRSLSILKKAESTSYSDLFRIGLKLSRLYLDINKTEEAQEVLNDLKTLQSTQKSDTQLEFILAQVKTLNQLQQPQIAQERAWDALSIMQNELGPSHSEFKTVWEVCLQRLTEPFLSPEARTVYTGIQSGDSYSIRTTLKNNPEWVNLKDASGWSLPQWACFFGHERTIDTLVELGASVDEIKDEWPMLHIACRWGHRRLIALLAGKVETQNQITKLGWHPLHRCAQNGESRLIELLMAADLNLNAVNDRGDTPLLLACRRGHYSLVVALIARGADVNKGNSLSGRSPLHEAAYIGHRAIVECLVHNDGDIESRDKAGLTPLELAVQADKEIVVNFIHSLAKGKKH